MVSIDSASFDAETSILTVGATVTVAIDVDGISAEDVELDVRAALYAYDSKDFYSYISGDETDNGGGSWTTTIDLSDYAADIGADHAFRRAEIVIRPTADLYSGEENEQEVAPISPSRTLDLSANDFADGYYAEIVDVAKCNECHEMLALTYHSANRSGNIVTCRMCHKPNSGGSHLELQSRSLDSYIHAIHAFQPFDPGDFDFTDPVEAMHYEHHIESTYPNFTTDESDTADTAAETWTTTDVGPETCTVCHGDAGEAHQAIYDAYADTN